MGPLSIKADVQAKAGAAKNQMLVIKTLADEARKKKQAEMKEAHAQELHQLKMAKEIAKAKAEGIPIDEDTIGASDGMLSIPKPGSKQPDTTIKSNNKGTNQPSHGLVVPPIGKDGPSVTLKNPEAGPSDTIPAMLTPGEAVIPASVAQDSAYRPVIEALVEEGRMRNRQPGGVKGFADGTESLPPMGKIEKRSMWDAITRKKEEPKKEEPAKQAGSLIENAKGVLGGRAAQLAAQEQKAVRGYADGVEDAGYEPGNRASFEAYYRPFAEKTAAGLGVSPNIILAQLGHETAWGKKTVGTYNLGNIKDFSGKEGSVAAYDSLEGSKDKYRSYGSPQEFFDDYGSLLERKFPGVKGSGDDVTKFVAGLTNEQGQKYATDPEYMQKLQRIVGGSAIPVGPDQSAAETSRLQSTVPKAHRRGGTSGFMRDMAQGMPNPVYDAELAKMATEGTPEDQSIAKAEMARLQRARSIPPVQTTDGQPLVPPPAPKAPDGFQVPKPSAGVPAVGPDEDAQRLPATVQVKAEALDKAMEDPQIKQEIAQLQATPPPQGADPKGWLAEGLSKIFGKTGMFNEEDLIRFGLLAAGGMLTGGSVGGSLRYAGLHTLSASDQRRAAQAAALAKQNEQLRAAQMEEFKYQRGKKDEAAKDVRERGQSLENTYHTKLDDADPKARVLADKLFVEARQAKDPMEREAKLQQAIHVLATNQVKKDSNGRNKDPLEGIDPVSRKAFEFKFDEQDRKLVRPSGSNSEWQLADKAGVNPIPNSEFRAREEAAVKRIADQLESRLVQINTANGKPLDKTYTAEVAKGHAKSIATTMLDMRDYFGTNFDDKKMSQVVSHIANAIKEEYKGKSLNELSPEALQKMVYGHAIVALRPTNADLYVRNTADGKKPAGVRATEAYGHVIKELVDSGENQDKTIKHLEETYKGLDPKTKRMWEQAAAVTDGYSPYLLWVAKKGKLN